MALSLLGTEFCFSHSAWPCSPTCTLQAVEGSKCHSGLNLPAKTVSNQQRCQLPMTLRPLYPPKSLGHILTPRQALQPKTSLLPDEAQRGERPDRLKAPGHLSQDSQGSLCSPPWSGAGGTRLETALHWQTGDLDRVLAQLPTSLWDPG